MLSKDARAGLRRWKNITLTALFTGLLGSAVPLLPQQAVTVQASERRIVPSPDGSPLLSPHH